jgi:hypothetical protein
MADLEELLQAILKFKYFADLSRGKVIEIVLDEKSYDFISNVIVEFGHEIGVSSGTGPLKLDSQLLGIKITRQSMEN